MIFACFLEFIKPMEMKDAAFIRIFQVCFGLHYHPSPFFLVPSQFVNSSALPLLPPMDWDHGVSTNHF